VRAAPERGSAVVEFALVLPLLLLMALALVQVGLLARDRLLVEAAARAGARQAAVDPDEGAVHDSAVAAAPGLDPSLATVSVTRSGTRGDPVTVAVGYADPIRVPFIAWLFHGSVQFKETAIERQEFG
jgi:Flp pilus assembly protein TadG